MTDQLLKRSGSNHRKPGKRTSSARKARALKLKVWLETRKPLTRRQQALYNKISHKRTSK